MSVAEAAVELVLLWHYHQPDYRDPRTGRSRLPWVRLHAAKDYLDMGARLASYPGLKMTFNFVPSLLDQIEEVDRAGGDDLFERLARPPESLDPAARREVARRCRHVPEHARERWPELRRLLDGGAGDPDPAALLALEIWFLLAWLDPSLLEEPAAARALAAAGAWTVAHRDELLSLHAGLPRRIVPLYRTLASAGQAELSVSPYYHPILPLLFDVRAARRAQPDLPMPREPFVHPEDARVHLERALRSHRERFGIEVRGLWPSEGSVSPETAELAAACGVRWMASDEGVLFRSLAEARPSRGLLYRPWNLRTVAGDVALFFRDRELSDRIGFVYQKWPAADAVADFLSRLRRIGREHASQPPPVVPVILDGENCWEGYAEDGGPFLDCLYGALEKASDVVTTTPSEILQRRPPNDTLPRLHSGSWIDSDFHIWIGHAEKNRAWELLSRARRNLDERPAAPDAARESLLRAEGSDWFWWFGDDHYTEDKDVFDDLFRAHLRATYELSGTPAPLALEVPITAPRTSGREPPVGFLAPVLDGRVTHFYEWHVAGHLELAGHGGAMHARTGSLRSLYFGFDRERLFLRVDLVPGFDGAGRGLRIEILEPVPSRWEIRSLLPGTPEVERIVEGRRERVPDARCCLDQVLEISLPFEALSFRPGDSVQLVIQILENGTPVETAPPGDAIRFEAPDESFDASAWGL